MVQFYQKRGAKTQATYVVPRADEVFSKHSPEWN
jgi:hypothetical protein